MYTPRYVHIRYGYTNVYTTSHTHIYTHTYIHTHTYIYTHMYTGNALVSNTTDAPVQAANTKTHGNAYAHALQYIYTSTYTYVYACNAGCSDGMDELSVCTACTNILLCLLVWGGYD